MTSVFIPVSVGELFDKITILEIKQEKILDKDKLLNVRKELNLLKEISNKIDTTPIKNIIDDLKNVNKELWHIEESKRNKEKLKLFDEKFIQLSRSVYLKNDIRAELKKQINILTNSTIVEEKSYR